MMVVADEDHPRKRSRLSLKSKKGEDGPSGEDADNPPPESLGTVPQDSLLTSISEPELNNCSPPVLELTESDLPCDGPDVPPVASLENMGNTCYLNCVLEVLRYTPCFLEGLEELYRHIVYLEKVKTSKVVQDSQEVKTEPCLAWDLVKNMFEMYKHMEKRENMFTQFASADVTSMAVKPDKVLDIIRSFNPMFDGNMQHDAQELLRCLLCYLEESEKELHSDYTKILVLAPALLKTPVPAVTMQESDRSGFGSNVEKLSSAGKSKWQRKSLIKALTFDQSPDESNEGAGNGEAEARTRMHSAGLKRPGSFCTDRLDAVQPNGKDWMECEAGPIKRPKLGHGEMKEMGMECDDEVDGLSRKRRRSPVAHSVQDKDSSKQELEQSELCQPLNTLRSKRRGTVNCRKLGNVDAKAVNCKAGVNSKIVNGRSDSPSQQLDKLEISLKSAVDSLNSSVRVRHKSGNDVSPCHGSDPSPRCADKSQPTILSMFERKNGSFRRLGMRGRTTQHTDNSKLNVPTVDLASEPGKMSPGRRRSPRKLNTCDPVLVTEKPTSCASTVYLNDTSQPLNQTCRRAKLGSPDYSPVACPALDTGGLESPTLRNPIKVSTRRHLKFGNANFSTDDYLSDDLPDLPPVGHSDSMGLHDLKMKRQQTGHPGGLLSAHTPTKPDRSSVSPSSLSPTVNGVFSQPSKLMIKLEKCDRLCNTPTISASAAIKALKESPDPCGEKGDSGSDQDEVGSVRDQEEDEVSLGTKSSFKSVPLKSVSVKVEKCDAVCDSPEKWVSARFATSCMARQRAQRFNMMEKLFQGTMVMRTKCLECERCTERRENFQDISLPLTTETSYDSDSDSEDENDSSLLRLMSAFTDVEHLRDSNKYYCEQCYRYVEAERSLHYDSLPNILTVHLKRFSTTGLSGFLSKINDHVTVPLLLNCLHYKCPKPCVRPDHRYTLFAIITHAGSTISAGHYLSYIKVRPNAVGHDLLSAYLTNTSSKKVTTDGQDSEGAMHSANLRQGSPLSTKDVAGTPTKDSHSTWPPPVCEKGNRPCGRTPEKPRTHRMSFRGDQTDRSANRECEEGGEYHWLECDDETIRILSERDFHSRLSQAEGSLRGTPYVLLYHRLDTWTAQ